MNSFVSYMSVKDFSLWDKKKNKRSLFSFDIEITARCNCNCRHCYINLPAGDKSAIKGEMSLKEIEEIADEAVSLGALWCLITGGEPLLRGDFSDIYVSLRRKGLLVSVFTNAILINPEHVRLFQRYPPRDIEVSVYGVTKETYESVTRIPGSFETFMRGLQLLISGGIRVRLKAMAIRSNLHELPEIARFCRRHTKDYFRFDPQLHQRLDGNSERNREIRQERLTPEEIVMLERADPERSKALQEACAKYIMPKSPVKGGNYLFRCGAGKYSFHLSYNGLFHLCSSLWHPDCIYDLKNGSLTDAWYRFVPHVRKMKSNRSDYLAKCGVCPFFVFCLWCPAHAYLETGDMDVPVNYFCEVTHARMQAMGVI